MVTGPRALGWALVAALWVTAAWLAPATSRTPERPVLAWLGPFADLAGNLEWIRFHRARLRGDQERALLHAENALQLRPEATAGWQLLAAHLGFFLASTEREPDPATRRGWFEAALEVTRRGAARAEEPAELQLYRGLLFLTKAEADAAIWPTGADGLLAEAEAAFREAAEAGHPDAPDSLRYVVELREE